MSESLSRQKIVYIITRSDIGGAQNHTMSLIKEFGGDYDLVLIAGSNGFLTDAAQGLGVKVYIVKQLDSFNVPIAVWRLREILSKEVPDLVHTHSSLASFYGRVAAKSCGLKTLYTVHGWHFASEKNRIKWVMKVIIELCCRYCTDRWIAVSAFDQKLGSAFHVFKPGRVDVIVNGVEDIKLEGIIPRSSNSKQALEVVFVGRATYQKNCLAAIDVLERTQGNVNLTMYASGGLMSSLESKITRSPMRDRVCLILDEPDAGRKLNQYDIMLITSRYEGMPLGGIEAMRAGLPIVSTDICGMNELIIRGESGYLFAQDDVVGMAAQLDVYAGDRALLIGMGQASRMRYQSVFTLDKMVSDTRAVYRRIIGE